MDRLSPRWPSVYVAWLPFAMLVAGTALDLAVPSPYTGLPLLAAAPLVAAATLSLRATAVCAALSCGAVLALVAHRYGVAHPAALMNTVSVVFTSLVAIEVSRVISRHGKRLAVVRTVAEVAQRALLPPPPARSGPVAIAAWYEAAQAEARIGGDVYAVRESPEGLRVLIGDVRGKGLGAVSTAAALLAAFREHAGDADGLEQLADRLERAQDVEGRADGEVPLEGFTTAVLGEVGWDGAAVRVLNRGHPPPYLVHEGRVRALEPEPPDLPLGLRPLRPDGAPGWAVRLPVGASLLLVTDGVTEARNPEGVFYDPVQRLAGEVFPRPEALVDTLVSDVARWTGGRRDDDMAILALTRVA